MIIFIHGQDAYQSRTKLNELRNKFIADVDPSRMNLTTLSGSTIDLEKFNKTIQAAPFMARKRMVVILNFWQTKSKDKKLCAGILEILDNHNEDRNVIIFCEETHFNDREIKKKDAELLRFLLKQKYVYYYPLPQGTALIKWIQGQVQSLELTITRDALETLALVVGDDSWGLHNELDKLAAYLKGQGKTEITKTEVDAMVLAKVSHSIFDLVDSIGLKQKSKALQLLHDLLESGVNELYLLTMITRQFRLLLLVQASQDRYPNPYDLSKAIGQNSFVVKKCLGQVHNFSRAQLRKIYNSLLEMDKRVKIGGGNIKTVFDLLILSI